MPTRPGIWSWRWPSSPWCRRRPWCCWCRAGSSKAWSTPRNSENIPMATVTLSAVTKSYAGTAVIHGIDCTIADGEFVVIVGPSGCGKSTLLRMVAGLEAITGGTIAIGERVVNRVEPKDRDIAMVFQNYALYPHMTVFENMAYGLKIRGFTKDAIRARV